jgi:hypothetical protein
MSRKKVYKDKQREKFLLRTADERHRAKIERQADRAAYLLAGHVTHALGGGAVEAFAAMGSPIAKEIAHRTGLDRPPATSSTDAEHEERPAEPDASSVPSSSSAVA